MSERVKVTVPGSSANIGPGYDVLAAAVSLELTLEVERTGNFSVDPGDEGLPRDESNLCVRAFKEICEIDEFSFRIESDIPVGAGLGSSGAAIVAGLVAANQISGWDLPPNKLLEPAVKLEGHPDNVGASMEGGIVICSVYDGQPHVDRIDPPDWVKAVVCVPEERLSTEAAREVIPDDIPLQESAANTASTALLMISLRSGLKDLLARGLQDQIHQPRRKDLYPRSMELVERASELGAIGATISGAGPTVLFWVNSDQEKSLVERLEEQVNGWAEVRSLEFVADGARVEVTGSSDL